MAMSNKAHEAPGTANCGHRDEMNRSCPMCGGRRPLVQRIIHKPEREYTIVKCIPCGFVYVLETPISTYEEERFAPDPVPARARHRHIKRLCDRMLARFGREATWRVVEIGAGWGGLGRLFSADERYRYVGFEPSAARADFCRSKGLEVRPHDFNGTRLADRIHAVVIDNVLEHLADPAAIVRDASSVLERNGILIVIVPNVRDIRQLYSGWRDRHHWQPHCHINYFSAGHLRRLFAANGMRCRYFGFSLLRRDDLAVIPRVTADAIGIHLLGLNCYGVKC